MLLSPSKHEKNSYISEDFSKTLIKFKCSYFKSPALSCSFRMWPLRGASLRKSAIMILSRHRCAGKREELIM